MAAVKRPQDTAFKQQRLRAWQPLLTPRWVIGTFAVTGALFIIVGIIMALVAASVHEYEQLYPSDCKIGSNCTLEIAIDADLEAPVFFYYKLTNFYQNHRRFVKSRDDKQLRGIASSLDSCEPLKTSQKNGLTNKFLYPCGLIASSFFNDKISAAINFESTSTDVGWSNKNIIWKSDADKFKANTDVYNPDASSSEYTRASFRDGRDITLPHVTDPDLIVWMRTAGLPTFKKLYRIKETGVIKAGSTLRFTIENNFDTLPFDGTKSIVVSTTSVLGGKNTFLTWAYIVVGIVCLLTAIAFAAKHAISPRKPGDLSYWEKNQ